jgi:hypothetical protein
MLLPKHREELVTFLRDLASAIEQGELQYKAFRLTPSVEHRVLPGGRIERDVCNMEFELRIVVESDKDYRRLLNGQRVASEIEDQQFHAGFRNRY